MRYCQAPHLSETRVVRPLSLAVEPMRLGGEFAECVRFVAAVYSPKWDDRYTIYDNDVINDHCVGIYLEPYEKHLSKPR